MKMDREELMQFILDHYENPRNYGPRLDADIVQKGGNPGCGDIVTLYLKFDINGIINDISFEGEGCILSQAATSMITEIVEGKSVEDVEKMSPDVITDIIGKELAMTRPRCTTLGLTTVKLALNERHKQETISQIEKEKEASNS